MRQTIFGLVAAMAVVAASAAPAVACGETPCGQTYIPAPVYWVATPAAAAGPMSGCPIRCKQYYPVQQYSVQQYYYVNQGPTYTGPGDFAPYPVYREGGVSGWRGYHHRHYYGYHRHHGYYAPRMSHHTGYGYRGHTLRRYY